MLKRKTISLLLSLFFTVFMLNGHDVIASTVKSTKVPFEDTTYTVENDADKPHDISSEEAANSTIDKFKEGTDFGIDVAGVEMIKGKTEAFVNMLTAIILGVAVTMIVLAGFRITKSEGNPEQMRQAKMQIIGAGIGVGIALFTMVILKGYLEIINVYNAP